VFIDNHDNSRFLQNNGYNLKTFQNALAWGLTYPGIPIVYYGDEQGYAGGNDPNNREVLWTNLSNTDSEMYQWMTTVVNYRKEQQLWNQEFVERYAAENFYCFSRGKAFMCFTNTSSEKNYTVTYHPYNVGDKICNIFYSTDCVTVTSSGVPVVLMNGEVKLYRLVSVEQ
jgi:alpha-amylase